MPALRVTELSERLLIRPPSVTGVVDRLEARGLVVVEPRVVRRAPVHVPVGARRSRPALTSEQESALRAICE